MIKRIATRMKRLIFLTLFVFGTIHLDSFAQEAPAISVQFQTGSNVLYEHYADNASALKQLHLLIDKYQNDLLTNRGHLQIIAPVAEGLSTDLPTLNQLATQASVVRAWIRVKHKALRKMSCAFSFPVATSSDTGIKVTYVASPLNPNAPQDTCYLKDKEREEIIPKFVLYFRLNKSNIDPTYMDNAAVINRMNRIVNADNIAYIDSLNISAYASPEAPSLYNKRLSERRANTVRSYLLNQFSLLNPEVVHAYGHGENWADLRQMVENDQQLPMRDEVLRIINSNASEDERERRLKALKGGTVYRYIYRNYYPRLRLGTSLKVMISPTAPEYLRDLIYGIQMRPQGIKFDTLQLSKPFLPLLNIPHYREVKYYRPIAIKTNLLFDAATLFNVEVEVPIQKKFSLLAEWTFPFWGGLGNAGGVAPVPTYSERYTIQMLSGGLEARYWFPRGEGLNNKAEQWGDYNPLNGWFVGFYGGAGLYDFQWNRQGMQGEFYIASGISGGYAHPIGKYFHMEYSLGIGYVATRYYNYTAMDGHKVVDIRTDGRYDRRQQSLFGPTKLKISLVWIPRFKVNSKKGESRK